ncbi:MAG: helix-turn-helix domain-containing protein [Turicibacter sanguinis]
MKEINVGKMIILKRKEKKITQDELAKYIGVSKAAISKWRQAKVIRYYIVTDFSGVF